MVCVEGARVAWVVPTVVGKGLRAYGMRRAEGGSDACSQRMRIIQVSSMGLRTLHPLAQGSKDLGLVTECAGMVITLFLVRATDDVEPCVDCCQVHTHCQSATQLHSAELHQGCWPVSGHTKTITS